MNWNELCGVIDARLTVTRIQFPDGAVRAANEPVDLDGIAEELLDDDAMEEYVRGLDEDGGRILEPLLSFEWLGLGPTSSDTSLTLLHLAERRWGVCWSAEVAGLQVIAALAPLSPETARAFFPDLVAGNGRSYGVELFGGLPSRTTNYRRDLIPAEVLEQCYWDWMQEASRDHPSLWTSLRDTVIAESEEPDHLRRSLRALVNLNQLGTPPTPNGIRSYLAERQQAGAALSTDERRLILGNYFAVSCVER